MMLSVPGVISTIKWLGPAIMADAHWELWENGKLVKQWPVGETPDVWLWERDDGSAAWMETRDGVHWIIAEAEGPRE